MSLLKRVTPIVAAAVMVPFAVGFTSDKNIVETAVDAGSFTTLVTAVQTAGLAETLAEGGPFTVFAPTDEAFAALPAGTVERLLANPEQLRQVLLYHVVEGRVTAADVGGLQRATSLQGAALRVNTASGVRINDARVVQADVMATNGVIHVIDQVLLPPTN